jgi:hypothetical protein
MMMMMMVVEMVMRMMMMIMMMNNDNDRVLDVDDSFTILCVLHHILQFTLDDDKVLKGMN